MLSSSDDPLTLNEDIVGRWREHFEELMNPKDTPPVQESEPEASGVFMTISLMEVTVVVKELLSGKAPWLDENSSLRMACPPQVGG